MADELVAGLYERLLTATLDDTLNDGVDLAGLTGPLDAADEPVALTRYLAGVIHDALLQQKDPGQRLRLANDLLQHLRHNDQVLDPARELLSVSAPPQSGRAALSVVRPTTRLSEPALMVTLNKSGKDRSPTTLYKDYAISEHLFHWESQSQTSLQSATGQRYVSSSSRVLLFVRDDAKDELGTAPYTFLGRARLDSYTGSRPVAITWRLDVPMPPDLFNAAKAIAG